MQGDDNKRRIKEKANFYIAEKLKAHISLSPKGIKNGFFKSDLIKETYYLFEDDIDGEVRLHLCDIFDINDFREAPND